MNGNSGLPVWQLIMLIISLLGGPAAVFGIFGKGFFSEFVGPKIREEIKKHYESKEIVDATRKATIEVIEDQIRRSDGIIAVEIKAKTDAAVETMHGKMNTTLETIEKTVKDSAARNERMEARISELKGGMDVLLRTQTTKS